MPIAVAEIRGAGQSQTAPPADRPHSNFLNFLGAANSNNPRKPESSTSTLPAQVSPAVNYAPKEANVSQDQPTASWEDLQGDFREVVGCNSTENCNLRFTAAQLATWLQYCKYRDPKRKGNPNFNANDLFYLHAKFRDAYAAYVQAYNIWVYKGHDMSDEQGVAYQLRTPMSVPTPNVMTMRYNQNVAEINQRNPLEVPIRNVSDVAFRGMATRGYTNENGEPVANAGEWRDYFGPKVGLMPEADPNQ